MPTDFGASTSFLYTATSPIQTGVTVGDMVPAHAAVIRGRVLDTDGAAPLPGVTVKILNHPEFGQTLSRSDGYYDLAVNGGAGYVVDFELTGRLSSQRAVKTTWLDYSVVDDVILVPLDTTAPATVTNVTSSSQFTVGPSVSDDAGTRHANLYIPANTSVHGYVGSTYTLRATEFTQGPLGRLMMPGTLPPQSAYTYAVDFSIDTLSSAQFDFTDPATHVVSPGTVYGYVENYLSIPVGSDVPTGYYDNTNGQWITSPNGKVIVILNSSGDVNYTGAKTGGVYNNETSTALAAIGLSADERSTITTQYGSGAQLWRFPMQHFTPFDTNWGFSFPAGAAPPPSAPPIPPLPPDDPCLGNGSIIECQSQILAEEIPIFGTPYTLRYQSDRVPGRSAKITIPISGSTLPTTQPSRVDVQIDVAGRRTVVSTPTPLATNQSVTWTWDRLDAYGRFVQGTVSAAIKVSYVYTGVQGAQPTSFAGYPLDTLTFSENLEAREISFDREYRVDVGGFDARTLGFGGWSLSAEHVYDPKGVLYRGDGRRQTGKALSPIVQTIAGGGGMADSSGDGHAATAAQLRLSSGEDGVAVGPDGSVYIAEVNNHVIRKVDTTGTISHFAGIYNPGADVGTFTEGVTAPTSVPMQPAALSIGPDGALYVAETSGGFRVLKITLDSPPKVYLVAGHLDSTHNTSSFSGDLGLAKSATLETPRNVVVGPDRSVYIATGDRVRRVTPDGIIDTIVGDGGCNSTLSGPAAGIPTGTPPVPRVSLCN
ncbi:MAG: hypothetical protein ACRELY_31590, partial [Polyangiaceae bacterium]